MIKAQTTASLVVGTYLACLLGYGLVKFPDAPLNFCEASTYCGKHGQPHTLKDYQRFEKWQTLLAWSWIPGVLVIFVLNRQRIRSRSRRKPTS